MRVVVQVTGACVFVGAVPCVCTTSSVVVTALVPTMGSNMTLCGINFGQPGPGSGVSVSGAARIAAREILPRTATSIFLSIGRGDGTNYALVVTAGGQVRVPQCRCICT